MKNEKYILILGTILMICILSCTQKGTENHKLFNLSSPKGINILSDVETAIVLSCGERINTSSDRFIKKMKTSGEHQQIFFDDRNKIVDFHLTINYLDDLSVQISLEVTNRSDSSLFIDRIESLTGIISTVHLPDTVKALFVGDWESRGGIIKFLVEESDIIDSRYTIAIDNPSFAGGFLTGSQHYNYFTVVREHNESLRLTAWGRADGAELKPGKSRKADDLYISSGKNSLLQLEEFAERAAKANNVKLWPNNRIAWCTWYAGWMYQEMYSYKNGIEKGIEENIPHLKSNFLTRGFGTIRICDDHLVYGDWNDTTKAFPRGLSYNAKLIKDAGLTPGVWYPVFFADIDSKVYKKHPEWFAEEKIGTKYITHFNQDGAMKPYMRSESDKFFVFDTSIPEVQDYFEETARKWVQRGFKYVSTDYMHYGIKPTIYHNAEFSKAQIIRKGMEAIKRGLGDTIFYRNIIGTDYGPSMGIAHDVRISGDSHGNNPSAYRNTGAVWYYNHRVWLNDPSAIVFKRYGELKDVDWNRMWVSWIALAGTVMTFGEQIDELPLEALNIYKKIFPPLNRAGRPLDLWENQPFTLWGMQPDEADGPYDLFGVFNLEENQNKTAMLNLDEISSRTRGWQKMDKVPGRYLLWDFWNEKLFISEGQSLKIEIPPKSGRIFAMRADLGRPQLLGTNGHFSMGFKETKKIKWHDSTNTLSGLAKGNGGDPVTLFFHLPSCYKLKYATIGGRKLNPLVKSEVIYLDIPAAKNLVSFNLVFKGKNASVPKDRDFADGKAAVIHK